MRELLDLPAVGTFVVFLFFGVVLFFVAYWALKYFSQHASNPYTIPSPAFLGTIATAWALSLGFVAADAWTINSRADYAIKKERSAIFRLLDTANPLVLNSPELDAAVRDYRDKVANIEWGRDNNTQPSPEVEHAILIIRSIVHKIAKEDHPGAVLSQLTSDFDELQDARNERLAISISSVDQYKWYLLLFLTTLTAITIAAIHADRKIAAVRALFLFSVTASISIWLLSTHADPFIGAGALEPKLLFKMK